MRLRPHWLSLVYCLSRKVSNWSIRWRVFFCNGPIFNTLIIRVEPNQLKDQLSMMVHAIGIFKMPRSLHFPFEERRAARDNGIGI